MDSKTFGRQAEGTKRQVKGRGSFGWQAWFFFTGKSVGKDHLSRTQSEYLPTHFVYSITNTWYCKKRQSKENKEKATRAKQFVKKGSCLLWVEISTRSVRTKHTKITL